MTLTYIRPDADDTDGNWTNESDVNTNLYQSIDETSFSDTDYIKSGHLPDHDICKIRLSDPSFITMRPATVHYRFKKRGETTQQINLDVSLLQGATEIAKWTETDIATSYVDGSQALTLAQFNSISDFNNLYLQFDASSSWWLAASEVDLWFEDNLYHLSTALSSASLLLHCDGADAATGVGAFIDATGRHQVTVVSAQVDTAQSKFGGASGLFSAAYLALDGSSDFAFGTGDFTTDFWIRYSSVTGSQNAVDFRASGGAGTGWAIYKNSSHKIIFFSNSSDQITGTTTIAIDTWYHIAIARSGTSTKLFINGAQEGSTYSDSNNYDVGVAAPGFGASTGGSQPSSCWMDEIRVLKGTAAWTTTFTPPTAPYNVALSGPYAHLSCSRASVGYATTSSGTLTQFAANALRITDLGLLVEDARQNLLLRSQEFGTTWTAENITITNDDTVAPDGTTTAEKIADTAGNSVHDAYQPSIEITGGSGITFSASCYFKAGTLNFAAINIFDVTGNTKYITVVANVSTGVITDTTTGAAGSTLTSTAIEALANGWYRLSIVGSITDTQVRLCICTSGSGTPSYNAGRPTYAGSATYIYAWGAQIEVGAFPSSYIATTTGSQTRAADAVTFIGNLNTVINATVASCVVDVSCQVVNNANVIGGSSQAMMYVDTASTNAVSSWNGSNVADFNFNSSGRTWATGVKIGEAGDANQRSLLAAGLGSPGVGGPWNFQNQSLGVSGTNFFGTYRRLTTWTSRLADADLQTMTDPAHTINFTTDEAAIDLDFVNAAYNAIALPTDFLIISRASVGYAQTLAGTLQLFGANQLRITDKGLLVEDARTNSIIRSQEFDDSTWVKNASGTVTVSANATTAPDGTSTADLLTVDGTDSCRIQPSGTFFTATSGIVNTCSIYVKANSGSTWCTLFVGDFATSFVRVWFNLTGSGTVGSNGVVGNGVFDSASIEALAGGWYRAILSFHMTTTLACGCTFNIAAGGDGVTTTTNGHSQYGWGAQLEAAPFPSSYIPTTSGSQTRAADDVACIGSLMTVVGSATASLVIDSMHLAAPTTDYLIAPISSDRSPMLAANDTQVRTFTTTDGGAAQLPTTLGNSLTFTIGVKAGTSWSAAGRSLVGGGGTVNTDAVDPTDLSDAHLGVSGAMPFCYFRRLTAWTTKLADVTLQGFTNP